MQPVRALLICLVAVLLPLLAASCAGHDDSTRPSIIPPLGAQVVAFNGSEGRLLGGTLMRSRESQRAVICIHMWNGDASDYDPLLPELAARGFNVLAFDLPGKRLSRGKAAEKAGMFSDSDLYRLRDHAFFERMLFDVKAAQQYMVEVCGVDPRRIALVGAGVGSTIALYTAERDPRPPAMVFLSPGRRYLGIDAAAKVPLIGDMPLLLISPKNATGQKDALKLFTDQQQPPLTHVQAVEVDADWDTGHGTRVLSQSATISRIVDFLDAAVR